jgi:hypothetical protein
MPSATTTDNLYKKYMYWILHGVRTYTPTASVWVGLFVTAPTTAGGGVEVVDNATTKYKRVEVPCTTEYWSNAQNQNLEINNLKEITFPVPGDSWGTINAAVIFDSATGNVVDNGLWIGIIVTPKPVSAGDGAPRILAGQLKISRASCP